LRVLAGLPQVLLADDLVGRPPEEHLEPLARRRPVAHAHDFVQIHCTAPYRGSNSQTAAAAEIHRVGYAIDVTLGWTESAGTVRDDGFDLL
jgi:hypothetical protein